MAAAATIQEQIADGLPKVWLRVDIDGEPAGVMKVLLRADVTPRTCENFRGLCTGEYGRGGRSGKQLTFVGSSVFRILPGQFMVAGDIEHNDGSGGECVFKPGRGALADGCLPDESFLLRHTGRGILSLASHRGPDTGASAFNLTLGPCPLLDERAVVFGYVVAGRGVLDAIEAAGDGDGWPTRRVTIGACGQVTGDGSAQPASVTRRASVAAGSRPASPGPPSAAGSRPASPAGPSASGAPPSAMAAGPGAGNDGRASGRAGDGAGATRAGASSGGPASGAAPGVAHYTTSAQAWPTGPGPRRHGPGGRTVADLEASGDLPRSLTPLQEAARRYGSNAAGRSHATVRASGGNEGAPGAGEGAPGGGQGAAGEGGGEGGRRRGAGDHGGRSE